MARKTPEPKDQLFLAKEARRKTELARQALGTSPCVYYEPAYGANGHLTPQGEFVPHGVPDGWELDLAAWDEQTGGPCPLKEKTNG